LSRASITYRKSKGGKKLNTKLRKIKNNAKALSPVVASIILIAVTVAVSVAVAAWMGGMTLGFMQTEQLKVSNPSFDVATNTATIDMINSGTQSLVISKVTIAGQDVSALSTITVGGVTSTAGSTFPYTLAANAQGTINLDCAGKLTLVAGDNYQITVTTSKGNQFSYSAVAPQ
jgi:flagellin-like protein